MLVEVMAVILLVSILAVPITGLLITVMRTTARAEAAATRLATATTIASIVSRVPLVDECDSVAMMEAVAARGIDVTPLIVISSDCSTVPTVVTVTVSDQYGEVELSAVRP